MLDVKRAAEISEILCIKYLQKFNRDLIKSAGKVWSEEAVGELKKVITGVLTCTPYDKVTDDMIKEMFNEIDNNDDVYTEVLFGSNSSIDSIGSIGSNNTVTYYGGEE